MSFVANEKYDIENIINQIYSIEYIRIKDAYPISFHEHRSANNKYYYKIGIVLENHTLEKSEMKGMMANFVNVNIENFKFTRTQ